MELDARPGAPRKHLANRVEGGLHKAMHRLEMQLVERAIHQPGEQTFDLILPEPQKDRIIEGVVLGADGRPARARLRMEDPRWPGWSTFGNADADGHFLLHSFDGTHYRLHAVGGQSSVSAISADPVEIQPGSAPLKLRLLLTRPGDSFRQPPPAR